MSLDRLFRPRSIAVVGGGTWCTNIIRECEKIGFAGDIWPVHPVKSEIGGRRAFASVTDLPDAPDATFIGVNRYATIEVVQSLSKMDAGGAVCFASGFLESDSETGDGADLQAKLIQAAGDMPFLGPNCYGFINALDRAALWPDQHGAVPCATGVALITQSSNIAINLTMQRRALPIAYVVTVGNQANVDLSQIGMALLDDPRVTALGLHIEGLTDIPAFEALATKARTMGKPIVALKVGASDQAQTATISHTASLAGSDAGAAALLHRLGIARVFSLSSLLETLKLLHIIGPLSSNRMASMSCSGGEASLMADSAIGLNVEFPPLNVDQRSGLSKALGPKVALANPLDYHTYIWGDTDAMTACYSAMMAGDLTLGAVVLDFPRADRCDPSDWLPVITSVAEAQRNSGKPIALITSLADTLPEDIAQYAMNKGIVTLSNIPDALHAIAAAAMLGQTIDPPAPALPAVAVTPTATLTEATAKAALSHHGLRIPRATHARLADIGQAADHIGYPIVLKGEGVAHKTEAGAVVLNLTSRDAVITAAHTMPTDHFLIEEMITSTVAELLIGVLRDPAHGFVMTVGAGGVLTELLADTQSVLIPSTRNDIHAALNRLRIAPLLAGYRGAASANMDSVLDAIMAVQDYVTQHANTVVEVEINPLLCTPNDAIAVDALIQIGDPS